MIRQADRMQLLLSSSDFWYGWGNVQTNSEAANSFCLLTPGMLSTADFPLRQPRFGTG